MIAFCQIAADSAFVFGLCQRCPAIAGTSIYTARRRADRSQPDISRGRLCGSVGGVTTTPGRSCRTASVMNIHDTVWIGS